MNWLMRSLENLYVDPSTDEYLYKNPSDSQSADRISHTVMDGEAIQRNDQAKSDRNQKENAGKNAQKTENYCFLCEKILFVMLTVFLASMLRVLYVEAVRAPCKASNGMERQTEMESIVLIGVSVSTAIVVRSYSSGQSGRVGAMVVLAVSSAVCIALSIYSAIALFREHRRPLHVTAVGFMILVLGQTALAVTALTFSAQDEASLTRSLLFSLRMAREQNSRHLRVWATTQHDLYCCGVTSSEDYRIPGRYFVHTEVPISCCSDYDSSRSDLLQERIREKCNLEKTYYMSGCKDPVLNLFRTSSNIVLGMTIVLIVLEVLTSILGLVISKKSKKCEQNIREKMENTP